MKWIDSWDDSVKTLAASNGHLGFTSHPFSWPISKPPQAQGRGIGVAEAHGLADHKVTASAKRRRAVMVASTGPFDLSCEVLYGSGGGTIIVYMNDAFFSKPYSFLMLFVRTPPLSTQHGFKWNMRRMPQSPLKQHVHRLSDCWMLPALHGESN